MQTMKRAEAERLHALHRCVEDVSLSAACRQA
jgi:hypothetical protein